MKPRSLQHGPVERSFGRSVTLGVSKVWTHTVLHDPQDQTHLSGPDLPRRRVAHYLVVRNPWRTLKPLVQDRRQSDAGRHVRINLQSRAIVHPIRIPWTVRHKPMQDQVQVPSGDRMEFL